jgi:hypothetical protein
MNAYLRLENDLRNVADTPLRETYIQTLVAFSRFAKSSDLSPAWQRLHELAQRLSDLDEGRVDPLLKPRKRGSGRGRDSSEKWNLRTRVLAGLEALCKSGMSEKDAARHIATAFPKVQGLATRGKDIPNTILRWKRDLHEEPHLREFGDNLFNDLMPLFEEASLAPDEWRTRADQMLQKLSDGLP